MLSQLSNVAADLWQIQNKIKLRQTNLGQNWPETDYDIPSHIDIFDKKLISKILDLSLFKFLIYLINVTSSNTKKNSSIYLQIFFNLVNFDEIGLKFRSTKYKSSFSSHFLSLTADSNLNQAKIWLKNTSILFRWFSVLNLEMCGAYINLPEALILQQPWRTATAESRECLMYIE